MKGAVGQPRQNIALVKGLTPSGVPSFHTCCQPESRRFAQIQAPVRRARKSAVIGRTGRIHSATAARMMRANTIVKMSTMATSFTSQAAFQRIRRPCRSRRKAGGRCRFHPGPMMTHPFIVRRVPIWVTDDFLSAFEASASPSLTINESLRTPDQDVAVEQETEAAEHPLLGNAAPADQCITDSGSERFAEGHPHSQLRDQGAGSRETIPGYRRAEPPLKPSLSLGVPDHASDASVHQRVLQKANVLVEVAVYASKHGTISVAHLLTDRKGSFSLNQLPCREAVPNRVAEQLPFGQTIPGARASRATPMIPKVACRGGLN